MLIKKDVSFLHGSILTKEMLNEIYVYPRHFIDLKYNVYSDGIIEGLNFIEENGITYLTRGIVKVSGECYFLLDDIDLTSYFKEMQKQHKWKDKVYYLYLKNKEAIKSDSIVEKQLDLYVSENKEKNLFFLCRFFGTEDNLYLPKLNYDKENEFDDLIENRLYVNLVDTLYAMPKRATYHPFLFEAVAEYLKQKQDKRALDYVILMQIQNMKVLSVEAMETYINADGYNNKENGDRESFFDLFVKCLQKKEEGNKIFLKDDKENKNFNMKQPRPKGMLL